jgi:shikimate kinase
MDFSNNIILIGFMGSGKTSTGKELAKLLKYNFWDMDQWIEGKNNKKVSEIFGEKGEGYFRSQEREAVDWLKNKDHYIVSVGGGTWIDQENREKLLRLGRCIWLIVSPEKVLERIGSHLSQRPILAQAKNPLREVNKILSTRTSFYSLAHLSFTTDEKKPKEIALEIVEVLKEDNFFDLPAV